MNQVERKSKKRPAWPAKFISQSTSITAWQLLKVILIILVSLVAGIALILGISSLARQNSSSGDTSAIIFSALQVPGQFPSLAAASCAEILLLNASALSGNYWVRAFNGSAVRVYCDMTSSCGGVPGSWLKVASLDFGNTSTPCLDELSERSDPVLRTCVIPTSSAACASIMFDYTSIIPYTRVCGRVLAYQFSSPDAFTGRNTIDDIYVDGVSLTHGSNPRQHIWTFVGGASRYTCECSNFEHTRIPPPAFVGQDYFCDSGINSRDYNGGIDYRRFFGGSPLWDGAGCSPNSSCCSFNNPPWFHKALPSPPTRDPIEMRVCRDQGRLDEDIAISSIDIYVQ